MTTELNVETYLPRQYGPGGSAWELVADVLHDMHGEAVTGFKTVNGSVRKLASTFRLTLHKSPNGFARSREPVDLCMVLLGSDTHNLHHCGIYWHGGVLHSQNGNNRYDGMYLIRSLYSQVEFWARA